MLPTIARGDANKVWIVPSELNKALEGLGSAVGPMASAIPQAAKGDFTAPPKVDVQAEIEKQFAEEEAKSQRTVQEAIDAAQELETARPAGARTSASTRRSGPAGADGPESLTSDGGPRAERHPDRRAHPAR